MLIAFFLLVLVLLGRLGWGLVRLWRAVPRRNEDFSLRLDRLSAGGSAGEARHV